MNHKDHTDEWDSFDDLLTWACWHLMESFTRGTALRSAMHHILNVARRAKFKPRAAQAAAQGGA